MSIPIKAGSMECARCLFEKQELDESIADWQQHDEDLNLELINQQELEAADEADASASFAKELKRRNIQ